MMLNPPIKRDKRPHLYFYPILAMHKVRIIVAGQEHEADFVVDHMTFFVQLCSNSQQKSGEYLYMAF
jgi:hypothetical protein